MKKCLQNDNLEKTYMRNKKDVVLVGLTFLLIITACVFSVLCLAEVPLPFFRRFFTLFSWIACLMLTLFFLVCMRCIYKGKETLFKTMFSGIILLAFSLILLYLLLKTGFFHVIKSKTSLEEYLSKTGVWMPIFYVVLQFLQVVVLPIPSTVSTLAGVALFGAFWAFIYSFIGILVGSLTAFFIGRKLGYKAVSWIVGEESLQKWQNKLRGKDNFLLTMMFLLPVFPDDVLCFVAGLSSMSNAYFISMLAISRLLSIATTCYSIQFIPLNTAWGLAVWGAFFLIVIIGFILIYKYSNQIQARLRKFKSSIQAKKK